MGLDTRPGVLLTVLAVTWVVITALVLVIAHLHARLRRLEQHTPAGEPRRAPAEPPYAALLGRDLAALTGAPDVRALVVLSTTCRSCRRLLAEPGWLEQAGPVALAWVDGTPGGPVPPGITVLPDGPRISAELGVRVTPFALVAGAGGTVDWAGPVGDPAALAARIRPRPTVPAP